MKSLISKYLLRAYYVPGVVLGLGNVVGTEGTQGAHRPLY